MKGNRIDGNTEKPTSLQYSKVVKNHKNALVQAWHAPSRGLQIHVH